MLDAESIGPEARCEMRCHFAYVANAFRAFVDTPEIESLAHHVDEIAPVPAAGVEDSHSGREPALEKLIEEIDVDFAELFAKTRRGISHVGQATSLE